jgi:cysteine-rich repeat protein
MKETMHMRKQGAVGSLVTSLLLCGALAAPSGAVCTGDCNGNGKVTVDELISMVNIALGNTAISACMPGDADGSGTISVNEIIIGVNSALNGCPVTPTPTPAAGTCGNGVVDFDKGETCDDGNTVEGDTCPANCRIAACTASGATLDADVQFMPPAGTDLAGITVFVRYPDGVVRIPGMANDVSVQNSLTNLPDNGFSTANDLDYALRLVIFTPDSSVLTPGRLATIHFEICTHAAQPQSGDFHCRVESAADTNGDTVNGTTCTVTLP